MQARIIRNSEEALLVVINDVLEYSKIEAGQLVIESRAMNLKETTAEPLELLAEPRVWATPDATAWRRAPAPGASVVGPQ